MEKIQCHNCQSECEPAARFCTSCGVPINREPVELREKKEQTKVRAVQSVFALYFILLIVCAILKFTNIEASYTVLNTVDVIMGIAVIAFAILNFKELIPALSSGSFRWWVFPVIIAGAILANLGINYLVDLLRSLQDDIFYTYMYEDTSNPFLWSVLSIAVQPAIFEEITFRGIMYNHLGKVMDYRAVIIVTGLLFAILHLSFISILWLAPFGIFAAWLRYKSGHIWYGVVFHFVYNCTYVILEGMQRGWFN